MFVLVASTNVFAADKSDECIQEQGTDKVVSNEDATLTAPATDPKATFLDQKEVKPANQ